MALVAFAWLSGIGHPDLLTDDEVRDQLLVRDCTDLGICHVAGANTSYEGLYHGAIWLDFLVAVRLLGGDDTSQRFVVYALLALSTATLFIVLWSWVSRAVAIPAAVLFAWALAQWQDASALVNPTLAAFPDVLTAAGLLCYGLSGRRRYLLLSAFTLGVAVDLHIASLSLVVPFVAVTAMARARPWPEIAGGLAVALGVYAIGSSAALRANFVALAEQGLVAPAAIAVCGVVLVAAACGARFRRLSWHARAWIVGVVLIVPFAVASLWLVGVAQHPLSAYYLHPILAPAAALAAAIGVSPLAAIGRRLPRLSSLRWLPAGLSLVAAGLVTFGVVEASAGPREHADWSMAAAEAIAAEMVRRGWSYEDLPFRLQSKDCRQLLRALAAVAPAPTPPARDDRQQLQVSTVSRDSAIGLSGKPVQLAANLVAVVREVSSWLRPRSMTACRVPLDPGRRRECEAALAWKGEASSPDPFLFVSRSYPEIHLVDVALPYVARYEIPLAPVAGESVEVTVVEPSTPGCRWLVTHVEGVSVDRALPASRVRLRAGDDAAGLLVVEKPFGVAACPATELDYRYPPCLVENVPGEPLPERADG